jgi:uridine phosphorylase
MAGGTPSSAATRPLSSAAVSARPVHLRPAFDLADRVLLPGDPHRALAVAQSLLDAPKMFNHSRGLWGYTGLARDGLPLTVQSTGIGGPSAAIVCEELIALGARRLVRVGTCTAIATALALGDLLAVQAVLPADGTSGALGAGGPLRPAAVLSERLVAAGARPATVVTSDLFYESRAGITREWMKRGAVAVDLAAAAVLRVAGRHGVEAACALAVTGVAGENGARASREEVEAVGVRLGEAGYSALAGGASIVAPRAAVEATTP